MRARSLSAAGFTLIEVLVSVSLISIFAGLAFSSILTGFSSLQLKSVASEAAAFVTTAANLADKKQEPVLFHIPSDGHSIVTKSLHSGVVHRLDFPRGIHIENPPGEQILFYPGGGAPNILLKLVSDRGARRTVSFDPMVGVASQVTE